MRVRTFALIVGLILALGAALFFALGTGNSDEPVSSGHRKSFFEKKAERAQARLNRHPEDKRLLLAGMRAWISAGNDWISKLETQTKPIPYFVSEDFQAGLLAWNRYLKQTDGEAGVAAAELAGNSFFNLVEIGSTQPDEAETNAAGAARALRIAGRKSPNLYTLSNLAVYEYFSGELAAGNRAAKAAAKTAPSKPESVIEQLNEYRERAERFLTRVKRGRQTLEESGENELKNPIKGYGSTAGINGYEPEEESESG